ncbi:MAG: PQQ-binding-like beta-propeller repeat protein [Planctomycetes bacterium]|nr:PQQ-binding-like beta-propeller repeat protein [Planctomycetota bacterium]
MVLPALLLLSSFLLTAPDPAAPPRPQEAGFSLLYWNQNGGNAAGDAAVDVSPVTREPVERWRRSVGELLSEPVVWGGTIYFVVADRRVHDLVAIDAETGEPVARIKVDQGNERCWVVVWEDLIGVLEPGRLSTFLAKNGKLIRKERLPVDCRSEPCLAGPVLYYHSSRTLHAVDLRSCVELGRAPAGAGRPACAGPLVVSSLAVGGGGGDLMPAGTAVSLRLMDQARAGQPWKPRAMSLRGGAVELSGAEQSPLVIPFHVPSDPTVKADRYSWFVRTARPVVLRSGGTDAACLLGGRGHLYSSPFVIGPVSTGRALVGFDADGRLMIQHTDGLYVSAHGDSEPPEGARSGPVRRARNVVYAGNFAVDLSTSRILWVMPDWQDDAGLIPLADQRLLRWTPDGELAAFGPSEGPVAAAEAPPLDPDAIRALAEGGSGQPPAAEFEVYLAWRRSLDPAFHAMLEECFEDYRRSRLLSDCRRLLLEGEAFGVDRPQLEVWAARLSGLKQNDAVNAEGQRRRVQRLEQRNRAQLATRYREAAVDCADLGLTGAATLLLTDSAALDRDQPADPDLLASWMPSELPFRGEQDAGERWQRWAREIVPADARFLSEQAPELLAVDHPFWKRDRIAFRTENLMLLTREAPPAAIGLCLRKGEAAIRILTRLFPAAEGHDLPPMEVRIHPSRGSYEAEVEEKDAPAMGSSLRWTSGYYAPEERVSRFFLPTGGGQWIDARDLHQVLAHELTHQFFSERCGWSEDLSLETPGFWVVEGIASFIEEQAVELGRRAGDLRDPTVPSLDASAQLLALEKLLPLEEFLLLDKEGFHELDANPTLPVSLRRTLGTRLMSEISIFYDQAGALSYFLMNERGEEGRATFLRYLQGYYEGTLEADGWQMLGFDAIDEFEQAFHAFLKGLG